MALSTGVADIPTASLLNVLDMTLDNLMAILQ